MDELDKMMQGMASNSSLNLAHNIGHTEFVDGIKNKKLQYTIIGESSDFLTGGYKTANIIFKMICFISPLLFVPAYAYYFSDWWLLFGILFSYLGTLLAGRKSLIPVYLFAYFIWEAIFGHFSFREYQVVFYMAMLWGYLWFQIAERSQNDYSFFELMNKPDLYTWAVEKDRIVVTERKNN